MSLSYICSYVCYIKFPTNIVIYTHQNLFKFFQSSWSGHLSSQIKFKIIMMIYIYFRPECLNPFHSLSSFFFVLVKSVGLIHVYILDVCFGVVNVVKVIIVSWGHFLR